jgi:DNA-binding PadR family transcriptional regulator
VIELATLGLLKESELHGYELKKRLRDVLGPLSSVSFGSLYPALAKLERNGHVKAVEAAEVVAPFPMTGSFAGEAAAFRTSVRGGAGRRLTTRGPRGKKVYGLTERGEARLAELLAAPAEDDRTFSLQLAFCRFCPAEARLALLRHRREVLEARLTDRRRAMSTTGERVDRYRRSLLEHDTESTERDIAWLDGLIEQETR